MDIVKFTERMNALGPFEACPRLGVAVSGGADSLALVLLADAWARARGGAVLALTVDHSLRAEAAVEARQVGAWLRSRQIVHRVLRWEGQKPKTGIQAAARDARYALLMERCRKEGVLHLLLAHQREDQAETFLFRLGRGSGLDGLAGMASISERTHLRLLRPLLDVPRADLRKTLEAANQPWIEDPSNEDRAFARVRIRAVLPVLDREGVTVQRLVDMTQQLTHARAERDGATAALLAEGAILYPEGYARIAKVAFLAASPECARAALARLLRVVGGGIHAPRRARIARLATALTQGDFRSGRTLGGCRVLVEAESFLLCREMRKEMPQPVLPGACFRWDRRFVVEMAPAKAGSAWAKQAKTWRLQRLGAQGWAEIVAVKPALRQSRIPAAVRPTLPAIWDRRGVFLVPHLGYDRGGGGTFLKRLDFQPFQPLAGATFAVA